ncbi:hypothetical protein [Schauerella aestuarii]|uniref:hypothetical protein n=1 Tax=Schauerella aestuarii TaxID=2511204 RepID=UPI00136AB55E|nr:hypothetical protein [Achromobacter aestuarii]MYZ43156.1 hypothetical protein [Achromobacter aestuarii]
MSRTPRLEPVVTAPVRAVLAWRVLGACIAASAVAAMAWSVWHTATPLAWALGIAAVAGAAAYLGYVQARGSRTPVVRAVRVLPRGTWQVRQGRTWRAVDIERCVRAGGMLTFHAAVHRLTPVGEGESRTLSFTVRRGRLSAERWRKLCVSVAVWAARPAREAEFA